MSMNLIYVADPMCSWCYGFGRTISELLAEPGDLQPLHLALVMGGLRPYTTELLKPERAQEIFSHWHHVAQASGLPFAASPHTALDEPGFIYDTEPASRAAITVRTLWPQHTWRYFKAVQTAFYAEGRNVTQAAVLADVAESVGLPRADFAKTFASTALREATAKDFAQSQAWGITGFPAVIAQKGDDLHLVCRGYAPVETLRARIAALMAAT
jgi:putative protein-disulfide isomerase